MRIVFLFALFWLLLSGLLYMLGCGANLPSWDGRLWLGDPPEIGITRVEEEPIGRLRIKCEEPQFGDYLCLSYEDFTSLYQILLNCKDWGSATMMSEKEQSGWIKRYESMQQIKATR